ncbi:MAG: ATP-binding protein [Clostridia bacterium]
MKKLSEIEADFIELSLPIGLMVIAASMDFEILFANEMFAKMLGCDSADELLQIYHRSAWNCVYPQDRDYLKEAAAKRNGKFEPCEIICRAVKKDGSLVWVNQHSRHALDENGNEIIFAYYTDITALKHMEETIVEGSNKYENLINSIPGGVGMYSWDEKFTPIFISERVYELCGMTKEEYCEATRESTLDVFHPDDRRGLIEAVQTAYKEKRKFNYNHRVVQKDGSYRWMRVSGQVMAAQDGTLILYTVFSDVNEQIKAEQALRESEFRYATAIKSSNINIWEYDYATDVMTIFSRSPRINQHNTAITNYIQSAMDEGHIREDSIDTFLDMIKRMKNGETEVTADLWIREQGDDKFWCERVTYTNIFDDNGNPVKAYCVGHDVTKEKEAEKRYSDELSYRQAMQKATMASINVNLTKNIVLDCKSIFPKVMARMSAAKTAQAYFDQMYTELTTENAQKECAAIFNRDAMLRRFAAGETTLSLELTRKIEGRRYWTVLTAHMMKRTEDNDVVAFLYSTNITNERTMQNVMNAIVKTDYDFLVVVDAERNSAVRYSENDFDNAYAYESDNFEEETHEYVRRYICQDDIARVVRELTIKNIIRQLDANGTYKIFYGMQDKYGAVSKKQLHFSYIDSKLKVFLMTRTDTTAAVEEQKKKNQELVAAVKMAEYANAAKSKFLSRISHEIRTPMNAIIGMAQIASQNLDNKALVIECIEKSQYSSQYLLSLLNDILDMSKIESGKVTLQNEVIVCKNFLDAVDTIIRVQAEEKGVAYTVTEFEGRKNNYIGDAIRLEQILINILTNAIKFTPKGGKVCLDISQISADDKIAELCFKISDTGIGIGKAFLANIFKPFSQEHNNSTTSYGGSGLGLAISKNLALLMGGDVFVESTLGIGTTFTVHIPLGIPQDSAELSAADCISENKAVYDFSGKRFLLVEDHQLNIMVAKKLLEYRNACVDVAENGSIGLSMFTAAPEHTYDAVLMDIRMPVMDGLQAAKGIRSLSRAWAKAVPIIAMSANAFEDDVIKSKNAGMNAHLAKPIDPELLYKTIYQLLSKEEERANGRNA